MEIEKVKKNKYVKVIKNNSLIDKTNNKINEIYISKKRLKYGKKFFKVFYTKRIKKLINKNHDEIVICGLGSCVELAKLLASHVLSLLKLAIENEEVSKIKVNDIVITEEGKETLLDLLNLEFENSSENKQTIMSEYKEREIELIKIKLKVAN